MIFDNLDRIQLTLDYMEANLKTDIKAEELSRMAGFSIFHYYALFHEATGLPVMQYLTRRRLLHAIYVIAEGHTMQDAALTYGFDTYAGFYRAFRREYGCSPSDYLKRHCPAKPYKIQLKQEAIIMISQKRIRDIAAHWNLGESDIRDIFYEGSGTISENDFYIGSDYVLRLSANLGTLERHAAVAQALTDGGLPSTIPIPLPDGRHILQDGELYGMLCRRLKGSNPSSHALFRRQDTHMARQFGCMIGRLHHVLEHIDSGIVSENNLYRTVCDWALPMIRQKLNPAFDYATDFGSLYDKLPRHIIHRNMNLSFLFMDGETLTGFTDFELSEINVRIFDPCYAATGILSENFEATRACIENWIPIYRSILQGYDEIAHMTPAEKKAAPYVIFSIQCICIAYFMDKEKYKDLAQINLRMLELLLEHFSELTL